VPRLDRRQAENLIDDVETWELNDDATRISRTFEFPNFIEAQALATRIADLGESQFHHPEITFGWDNCRVEFQTRKNRGLHENDFIMAAKVNELHKGAAVAEQGED
jgi:4a-hydroxytetrahydrobiopterin dehydratase